MTRHLRAVGPTDRAEDFDEALDPAAEADRAWFEEHPEAAVRLRHFLVGENPDPGPTPAGFEAWVKVTQVIPGVRYRQVGYARTGTLPVTFLPEIDGDLQRRLQLRAERA